MVEFLLNMMAEEAERKARSLARAKELGYTGSMDWSVKGGNTREEENGIRETGIRTCHLAKKSLEYIL